MRGSSKYALLGGLLGQRRGNAKNVTQLTAFDRDDCYGIGMCRIITRAELVNIEAELRAMVAAEPAVEVQQALSRLVDRYCAMSSDPVQAPQPVVLPMAF